MIRDNALKNEVEQISSPCSDPNDLDRIWWILHPLPESYLPKIRKFDWNSNPEAEENVEQKND